MNTGNFAPNRLKSFIERIENVDGEIAELALDKKEIFAEAKALGYNTKVMRKVIAIRKLDPKDRQEMEMEVETYMNAVEGSNEDE